MGIIKVSSSLRVLDFCEKPAEVGEVENFAVTPTTRTLGGDKLFLGSMGIYLFNTPVLVDALDNKEIDFGRGVIPLAAKKYKMLCYPFDGYWQDVGTIKAFYEANMAWREGRGIAEMFQDGNVIYTNSRQLPPTRINGTAITDSLIADGGNIQASEIQRSIIGVRTRINTGTVIKDSIVMGNDHNVKDHQFEIGANCLLEKTICDKNAVIGDGCRITNAAGVQEGESEYCVIRSGLVVIPPDTVIPAGTVI
jgi:glucose-1-phosphate adenylyltransferase